MHDGSITIRIAADVKEIERLNRVVRQFGELHEVPGRTLYSVNLALDAAWRFAGMPDAFYRDWVGVAREEALHLAKLRIA